MNDTIVALSSAHGLAPRAIIRLSGPDCDRILAPSIDDSSGPWKALPGFQWASIRLRIFERIVPATLYSMRAPRSYTGDDVLELHIPGSQPFVARLLEDLIIQGARPAEPGEFTRRAYLSGRIGLAQAESVAQLLSARSDNAHRLALSRLKGPIEDRLSQIRDLFLTVFAAVEGHLDFTETDTEYLDQESVRGILRDVEHRLAETEAAVRSREQKGATVNVLLVGPPNAGKSSLFSHWIPERRTLVSPAPGTTRDLLEGPLSFGDQTITLWDAPGIFDSDDPLEVHAIERLFDFFEESDLFLVILDAGQVPDPVWIHDIERRIRGRDFLVVIGRCDLSASGQSLEFARRISAKGLAPIEISVKDGRGLDELKDAVFAKAEVLSEAQESAPWHVDTTLMAALSRARVSVQSAISKDLETELELAVFELREALYGLSTWVGDIGAEDILDQIFAKFCIGK